MKKLLSISLILFLIGCQKNGVIEEIDATGNICFNTYKDGKLDGLSTCYYYNSSQKRSESTYKEGVRNNHKEWSEKGNLRRSILYLSNKISHDKSFYENGQKSDCLYYNADNGKLDWVVSYFENGITSYYQDYDEYGRKTGKEKIRSWDWEAGKAYTYCHYNWEEGKKDGNQLQYNKYGYVEVAEKYHKGTRLVHLKYKYEGKNDTKGTLISKECWDIYGNKKECN